MPSHNEIRLLPYSADLMYTIVADVEKYPDYLPWCVGLRVLSRERVERQSVLRAEMLVGFGAIRERYVSQVLLDPEARTIDISHIEGPFRQLESRWRFTQEGESCKVDFSIDFEFKNRLLNAVAGGAFEHALLRMTDAFQERAKALQQPA